LDKPIIAYTSSFCSHSWWVERFLRSKEVTVEYINIDKNPQAREAVKSLNRGYASVPTLVFPDGSHLTEPSLAQIRQKLNIETPSLVDRLKGLLDR
jgi:mycoredoxin